MGAADTDHRWRFGEVIAEPHESVGTHVHPGEPEAIANLEGNVELHGSGGVAPGVAQALGSAGPRLVGVETTGGAGLLQAAEPSLHLRALLVGGAVSDVDHLDLQARHPNVDDRAFLGAIGQVGFADAPLLLAIADQEDGPPIGDAVDDGSLRVVGTFVRGHRQLLAL